jgi:hypothetical protein
MNTYEITIKLPNKEAFTDFIEKVGPVAGQMTVSVSKVVREQSIGDTQSPYKPRREHGPPQPKRVRSSKVNDTILATLGEQGEASAKDLKDALERASLSPGSLSTGLAALQKSGQIERVREGVYGIVSNHQQAAE